MTLAVILAGGRSQRMGHNKATVKLSGARLVDRVSARLIQQGLTVALNAGQNFETALTVIPDRLEGFRGPLAGILASMRHAVTIPQAPTHVLTVPIDSPFIPHDLMARLHTALVGSRSIAIATSLGATHPVVGLWPTSLADDLQAFLETPENPRVKAFLSKHDTQLVDFPAISTPLGPIDPFFNVNTPEDLELAHRYVEFVP